MDLEQMRKELEALRSGGNTKSSSKTDGIKYFRMQPGNNYRVRFVEASDGPPIKQWHWHYGVNNNNFVCNKRNFGEDCPVCDLASSIWQEYVATQEAGSPDESLKAAAKKLFARDRFYANVLVRGEESEGVQVFSFGKQAAEMIYECFLNPDYEGKFLDAREGYDFTIKYTRDDPNDVRTSKTLIMPTVKASPIADSNSSIEDIVASAHNLDNLYSATDRDDMLAALDSVGTPDIDSVGTAKYGSNSSTGSSVMDAIRNLEASD